jgi:hypothetical protein
VSSLESGYEGGFTGHPVASISFYSERFLALLRPGERKRLEFRPIQRAGRSRKQFFELIGKPAVPYVFVKGFKAAGWECGSCGH